MITAKYEVGSSEVIQIVKEFIKQKYNLKTVDAVAVELERDYDGYSSHDMKLSKIVVTCHNPEGADNVATVTDLVRKLEIGKL